MTIDEALENVWTYRDDRQTALVLAAEVVTLRERVAELERVGDVFHETIDNMLDELAAV